MADPRKYSLSRRVMPGQRGIVDQNTRQVEKRLFDLVRSQEFTGNLHWYISDTAIGAIGDIGARLDKTDTSATAPLGFDFLVGGSPVWSLNVDSSKDFTISDQSGTKGSCFQINTSGKVTVAHDFSHAGTNLGFYGAAVTTQPLGSSDVLASLVTLGLRGASSNPPFNIGTGQITCGKVVASDTSNFSTSSNAQVLVLNAGTSVAATIKCNPSPGTKRNTIQMGGIFQWGTDINFNGGSDFWFQSLVTGNAFMLCDGSDKLTLGTANPSGGVVCAVSGGKLGFYGATTITQPAGTTDVLASLVSLGLRAASSNPPLNLGTGTITCGQINGPSGLAFKRVTIAPSADADYTLLSTEYSGFYIAVNVGSWTAGHNLIVPTNAGSTWVFFNNTGFTATVKTAAGAGVAIATGKRAIVSCDGTDIFRVTADA